MGVPGSIPGIVIPLAGLMVFFHLLRRRLRPLLSAQTAPWRDRAALRLKNLIRFGVFQTRQARYFQHAVTHGLIMYAFIFSVPHLLLMVCQGLPGVGEPAGEFWRMYTALCDVAATAIITGCALALFCRLGPYRRRYPENRRLSAFGILAFVTALTASEIVFRSVFLAAAPGTIFSFTLASLLSTLWGHAPEHSLNAIACAAWLVHEFLFFGFLCILPVSKQFHEILGPASLWCMRLDKGYVKPCRYGISEAETDELPYLGIAAMQDCTWRQLLHFYSCADCGRCSDNCPATLAGRELSPREFTFKGRRALEGGESAPPWTAGEIWGCTLCGACEEECPLGIGYLDVMVDLRRQAADQGRIPRSIGRAMTLLQQSGTPVATDSAAPPWPPETPPEMSPKASSGHTARRSKDKTLYLPAAFTIHDPRARGMADAVYALLARARHNPVLLPGPVRDAGHEARRWGDEYLYRNLRDMLRAAIAKNNASRIVTEDPHTLNALRNDYGLGLPVLHSSEVLSRDLAAGGLVPIRGHDSREYAFHDPCFLGRHNGIYDAPRLALDALGLTRKELPRHRDRTFCCGGPTAFFHEPEEQQRPACLRLEEARSAGVDVLVTACPWCLVNFTENSREMGLSLSVRDIAELVMERVGGERSTVFFEHGRRRAEANLYGADRASAPGLPKTPEQNRPVRPTDFSECQPTGKKTF